MNERVLYVPIGQMKIARSGEILTCLLGSCIGIGLMDRGRGLFGLAHCVLPLAPLDLSPDLRGRYVDSGVMELLDQMEVSLTGRRQIEAVLVGGAQMIHHRLVGVANGFDDESPADTIGDRNVQSARAILKKLRISVCFEEFGGNLGRILSLDSQIGKVLVRAIQDEGTYE